MGVLSDIDALLSDLKEQDEPKKDDPSKEKDAPKKKDDPKKKPEMATPVAPVVDDEAPPSDTTVKTPESPKKKDDAEDVDEASMSAAARDFISKEIEYLIKDKGYDHDRAVAAAYAIARRKGYKVPPPPRKEDEEEPKKTPERSDDDEGKKKLGISAEAYEAMKAEFNSMTEFLERYRDGADDAFENQINENDTPLVIEKKEKPPKSWFTNVVRIMESDPTVDDPVALATHMWYNWMSPTAKAKAKR